MNRKNTMNRFLRSVRASVAAVLAAGALAAAWPATAQATYVPPWGSDSNSVGGLTFYNAAGTPITGGTITDAPLAAYVEGGTAPRAGDTTATLFGYLPVNGHDPGTWSGEQLSTSTAYPNAGAPGALASATLPLVTGGVGDKTIANLASDFPNTDVSGDGYAGLYVLRLRTSVAGKPGLTTYDSTVIQVTGSTWSVYAPTGPTITPTTPSISNLPSGARVGGSFVATVSTDGDGTKSVSSNSPSICTVGLDGLTVSYLAVGTCSLTSHVAAGTTYLAADGSAQTFSVAAAAAYPYHPVTPTRVCDTRAASGTAIAANQCNNEGGAAGSLHSGQTIDVTVADGATVPSNATAVVLNVAVTDTTSSSFLSVYPTGLSRPNASNLNWSPGVTIPNLVEVPVGSAGKVTVYNLAGQADVVIDVEGYVAPGANAYTGLYNAVAPTRICDTRASSGSAVVTNQCNNAGAGLAFQTGTTRAIQIEGEGPIPASGVSAVALNIAVTNTSSAGFLTAWPDDGSGRPNASNLNWSAGATIPNRVIVPVAADGKIDLYNLAGNTDVIVDVTGWFTDSNNVLATGSLYLPVTPTRICDSRAAVLGAVAANQCNHNGIGTGTWSSGTVNPVAVVGNAGVPTGATAAVLNVAVTNTSSSSFLTLWPDDGSARPNASDLNWTPGLTIPNLVIATLPSSGAHAGSVNVFNLSGAADVVVDVEGYYVPSGA
jgi:hypothetical protein